MDAWSQSRSSPAWGRAPRGGPRGGGRVRGAPPPLLFTALNNQFFSANLNGPMASLPTVIFQFALSPYKDWQHLAWTGALIITVTVLLLSIMARAIGTPRTAK